MIRQRVEGEVTCARSPSSSVPESGIESRPSVSQSSVLPIGQCCLCFSWLFRKMDIYLPSSQGWRGSVFGKHFEIRIIGRDLFCAPVQRGGHSLNPCTPRVQRQGLPSTAWPWCTFPFYRGWWTEVSMDG